MFYVTSGDVTNKRIYEIVCVTPKQIYVTSCMRFFGRTSEQIHVTGVTYT